MARKINSSAREAHASLVGWTLTWAFWLERVTRIELALSAWEDYGTGHFMPADCTSDYP
jgi:hypothetical protein